MKQEVNRKHASDKWALDDVVMTSEVTHPPKVRSLRQHTRPAFAGSSPWQRGDAWEASAPADECEVLTVGLSLLCDTHCTCRSLRT